MFPSLFKIYFRFLCYSLSSDRWNHKRNISHQPNDTESHPKSSKGQSKCWMCSAWVFGDWFHIGNSHSNELILCLFLRILIPYYRLTKDAHCLLMTRTWPLQTWTNSWCFFVTALAAQFSFIYLLPWLLLCWSLAY